MSFPKYDIDRVKKARPDLSDEQCNDVLVFLCETYNDEPYSHNEEHFRNAADMMFKESNNG